MIFYFLPDRGIFGGVKVACQFADMLGSLGLPVVVATDDGRAPQWFETRAPVITAAEAIARIGPRDWAMITWPPDHLRLKSLPGRMVCHCQGTDPRMDPILGDPDVLVLTCWEQATRYVRERFGRTAIEVGISIHDCFMFGGERKLDDCVAYMPRRGADLARACMRAAPALDFEAIDGVGEIEVSRRLKRAGVFLATAVGEEFGLPALEAMAAGCLVVSVPVKGGLEFLRDGENCVMAEPERLAEALRAATTRASAPRRALLRHRAVATAARYLRIRQCERLRVLLRTELGALAP